MIKYIRVTLWGRLYVTLKEMHCLIGFASEAEGKSQFKKKKLIQYCSGRRPPPGSRIGISPPRGVITWQMIRIRLLLSGVSTQGSKAQESSFTFPVNTSATERCSPGTRLLRAVPSTFSFLPEFVLPLSTIKGSHLQPPIRTNLPANWSVLLYSAPVYLGLCRLQNH